MQTWFQAFRRDNGEAVTVEWGYSGGEVLVESAWREGADVHDEDYAVELTAAEDERFTAEVMALQPFPPHEADDYLD